VQENATDHDVLLVQLMQKYKGTKVQRYKGIKEFAESRTTDW
jgi:hypothetical protein